MLLQSARRPHILKSSLRSYYIAAMMIVIISWFDFTPAQVLPKIRANKILHINVLLHATHSITHYKVIDSYIFREFTRKIRSWI